MGWWDRAGRGEIEYTPAETAQLDQLDKHLQEIGPKALRDGFRAQGAEKYGTREEAKAARDTARASDREHRQTLAKSRAIEQQADARTQQKKRGR